MKIYGFLVLAIVPVASFSAPSIRMLGTQPAMVSSASYNAKALPLKNTETNSVSSVRIGSLQAKAKSGSALSITGANSESRFSGISSIRSYNSVKAPKITTNNTPSNTTSNVDVDKIVDSVTQRIGNTYYTKEEVNDKLDDPRIDAIRIGSRPSHEVELPDGYVYMWIVENKNN